MFVDYRTHKYIKKERTKSVVVISDPPVLQKQPEGITKVTIRILVPVTDYLLCKILSHISYVLTYVRSYLLIDESCSHFYGRNREEKTKYDC